ncbi:tetratricopeptide repeat protein [Verrucomicrobium spinosum]|uniref:tetratricopeptide repeat protein n=1 Tax=Verrucomicrobium spinosum TaxID=2736 RepID=UPI000A9525BA|nr:tetratricopeptide repeat protein [Verrucomicrobium spinosum]
MLADTLLLLQRDEEADKAVARAVDAARKAHGNEPPALARDLSMLAQIYYGQLRYARALPLAREALTLAEQNFPDESRDVGLYQSRVGASWCSQAVMMRARRRCWRSPARTC